MPFVENRLQEDILKKGNTKKAEDLLRSLSLMQDCDDSGQFCQVTLAQLLQVFKFIDYGIFLTFSAQSGTFEIESSEGFSEKENGQTAAYMIETAHQPELEQVLMTGEAVFSGSNAALSLVRGDVILGAILLRSNEIWKTEDKALLAQFSRNISRSFETTVLLEEAETLAYQDALTSLGNRLSFKKGIQATINQVANNSPQQFAVIQFVLDNLPELNIALGHAAGDNLLRRTAEQLQRLFPNAIALARTSGDGFGICTPVSSNDEISDLPDIINALFDVYLPDELNLPHLVPRIGLALYPADGHTAEDLWKNTGIALANTKKQGSPNFCYYDSHIETEIYGRITLNNELREGMARGELSLSYQPQICLKDGNLTGVEALLRWQREDGVFVPADTFIPIAEASGLLGPISEWVLREACSQRKKWTEQGVPDFPVAVNISLNEFQSEDFVPFVQKILEETAIPAHLLDIELTESVLMQDRGQTKRNMRRLKSIGVRLSIDDFGTGYSSLSYLSHLPASVLKIDKSFIDGIALNASDAAIARAIIALGQNLGMNILAEGVENHEQVAFLQAEGCHQAQGFVFSKAVPADDIQALALKPSFLKPAR